ncbi:spore germination lipoprotein GerD [Bacillus horti]|nr:spore germination lipoprotein GerD [Bacillus horti]
MLQPPTTKRFIMLSNSFLKKPKKSHKLPWTLLVFILLTILCSCSPKDNQNSADYNATKQMVLDILHTDEGKKAVEEAIGNEEAQKKMILEAPEVKKAVQESLLSEDNKKKLEELMGDPEFIKEYAKQLEEEHKKWLKDLMKDPEYRTSMQEILKDPEMEKQFLELTKSKEFRQQTMTVMKEAIQSPYFRLELLQLMSEVAKDSLGGEKKEGEGGEGGQESEGQGGGGSEDSGGG